MRDFRNTLFKDNIHFYKILSLLLGILSIIMAVLTLRLYLQFQKQQESSIIENPSVPNKKIPMYNEIMSIIDPLQYSGLQALLRSDVSLQIDFTTRLWRLTNIHHFDQEGNIILDENRYGLCGELAAFVYPKIKSILGPLYSIDFARVAESGFFLQPQSSHIALQIKNKATSEAFLIDPSFHRYSPLSACGNYLFYGYQDSLSFVTNQIKDLEFEVNTGIPIFIHKDMLLFLIVETSEGRFDEQNFVIAVAATRRYQYAGRYILLITRKEGKISVLENTNLIKQLFKKEVYEALYQKILLWASSQP